MYGDMAQRASRGEVSLSHELSRPRSSSDKCFDSTLFRRALGHYATGVAVLTAVTRTGEHLGVTVNSFSSVSLNPPLISVCLGKFLCSLHAIKAARAFNVNILCRGQEALSAQFARRGAEKWSGVRFEIARNGVRTVEPNLAVLECSRYRVYPAGDHHILLGRVEYFRLNGIEEPLLFYRGQYRTLGTSEMEPDHYGT